MFCIKFMVTLSVFVSLNLGLNEHDGVEEEEDDNTPQNPLGAVRLNSPRDKCKNKETDACNMTRVLSELLNGYDKRLRPFIDENKPVTITVGIWILSIDSINVVDMDYRIDFFLRQSWHDPRLKNSYHDQMTISSAVLDQIWTPDTYFENSKHSDFHYVTVPNKMFRLYPNGTVLYNSSAPDCESFVKCYYKENFDFDLFTRISVRASCPMDLRLFPVDKQECHLHIESYGYSATHIQYTWEQHDQRITIDNKVKQLPQYNMTKFETFAMETPWVVGNWSSLKATFVLERQYGHFFLHLYAPCAMIVMLSWISFFIPKEAIAARIALSITAVLTTTTVLNMQNSVLPKVSYIKLADWYLIISFAFVFGVFMEYTTILYLTRKAVQKEYKEKKKNKTAKDNNNHHHITNGECTVKKFEEAFSKFEFNGKENNDSSTLLKQNGCYGVKPTILELLEGPHSNNSSHALVDEMKNEGENVNSTDFLEKNENQYPCNFHVGLIDEYSRIMFPMAFLVFNIIYWLFFFTKKHG